MKDIARSNGKTALITGASAGFGAEFAEVFAREGYDLLLVARSEERLKAVSSKVNSTYGRKVKILALDLTTEDSGKKVFAWAQKQAPSVDCLVNNAGIGNYGRFAEIPLEKERELLELNIGVLTELCHRFIPLMIKQGGGRILNVASLAAFQAGAYYATYYASKAYVLLFTEALGLEYKKDKVIISALCPGPSPTSFFEKSKMADTSWLFRTQMIPPKQVAEAGYKGLMAGRDIIIPSKKYFIVPLSARLFPRWLMARINKRLVEIIAKG